MNALHLSAKHGHSNIIEVILSNKTEIESKTGLTLLDLWQAVSSKTGYTALHVATEAGNVSCFLSDAFLLSVVV